MNGPGNSVQIAGVLLLFGVLIALIAIAIRIRPTQPEQIVVQPAPLPKIVVQAPEVPQTATPQVVIIGNQTPYMLSAAQNEEPQSLRRHLLGSSFGIHRNIGETLSGASVALAVLIDEGHGRRRRQPGRLPLLLLT